MLVLSWPVGAGMPHSGLGDHHEAGRVAVVVLDTRCQRLEPVEVGGVLGTDGDDLGVLCFGHSPYGV